MRPFCTLVLPRSTNFRGKNLNEVMEEATSQETESEQRCDESQTTFPTTGPNIDDTRVPASLATRDHRGLSCFASDQAVSSLVTGGSRS